MASKYTPEQHAFFKENISGLSYVEIQSQFYGTFGVRLSLNQIKGYLGNHKLKTGRTGRFTSGHLPANKGQKGIHYPGSEKGWFKKGDMPQTWKPVGTETVRSDGYTWVKVAEPNKWREKHKIIWEAAHGPAPRSHAVIFADGDKQNLLLENLILVSRAQLARLNQNNLIANDAELTRTGILVADVISKTAQRRRGSKNNRRGVTR